jgi:hypothetical protein
MTEKRIVATNQVLRHVAEAREVLRHLNDGSATRDGVLRNPDVQGAALKIAAEELRKALAVFDRTKWK